MNLGLNVNLEFVIFYFLFLALNQIGIRAVKHTGDVTGPGPFGPIGPGFWAHFGRFGQIWTYLDPLELLQFQKCQFLKMYSRLRHVA